MNLNKHLFLFSLLGLFLVATSSFPANSREPQLEFKTSKGLKIVFIPDPDMAFLHAELAISYKGKFKNPAIPRLILLNLFNKKVNTKGAALLATLKKLGNDYKIEQTPDYFILKINFLQERFKEFARLLRIIYKHKLFQMVKHGDSYSRKRENEKLRRFSLCVNEYWRYYLEGEDWKRDLAFQIGYSRLFSGAPAGNTLVTSDFLKEASWSDMRKFYQRVFRFPNSLLIIKGNIKTYHAFGLIEREFASFEEQEPEMPVPEKVSVNNQREVIIFNINAPDLPVLYRFEAIPPINSKSYINMLAINTILFGLPTSRLNRIAPAPGLPGLAIDTEIINHSKGSVVCNRVAGLRFKDVEKFILYADKQKRILRMNKIDRREFLNTRSYIFGKLKVNSRHFDNGIVNKILKQFYSFNEIDFFTSPQKKDEFSVVSINKHLDNSRKGIILIVGNARALLPHFKHITPVVLNYKGAGATPFFKIQHF
ncbi:MAG: insulinase family protein [bacterium]|nr:insulinase family protein [bacterium]